jgi:hypothetical protein
MSLPGKILYRLWYQPIAKVQACVREGGPWEQLQNRRGQLQMQAAAHQLPPMPRSHADAPELRVHLLSGQRFAYQSVFCLYTLAKRIGNSSLIPEIYDDGSLAGEAEKLIREKFPQALIHPYRELVDQLDARLPLAQFPTLRERWLNYPHIRKLIDVHLADGPTDWRLVLDSDLLFWRRPEALLQWVAKPSAPIHAIDSVENYGYPREALARIAGCEIPPLVNVGLIGLQSSSIDWDFLESASKTLISAHGTSYYLEQALSALLVARSVKSPIAVPGGEYLTAPSPREIQNPTAVMHHYVDLTRGPYHRLAWRKVDSAP